MAKYVLLVLFAAALLAGCPNHANQQGYTVTGYRVVVTQSQPVVVSQPQPVYVTQPRVVVHRPVVYTQPAPVQRPVRVYVGGSYPVYRHCSPGATRHCEAYCGGGIQTCNPDGMSWGPCIEQYNYYY